MNIAETLERGGSRFPDRTALIFEGQSFTYRELDDLSSRVAQGLSRLGVTRGDRVAIFLPNIPVFVHVYFGILKIGAIAVSANALLKADEIGYLLNDTGAVLLITTEALRAHIPVNSLPCLKHIIIAEGEAKTDTPLSDLMANTSPGVRAVHVAPDEVAVIHHAMATAGFPKGAALTHANMYWNMHVSVQAFGLRASDRVLLFLPVFHVFGQGVAMLTCFDVGATLYLHRKYSSAVIPRSIEENRITVVFGTPAVYIIMYGKATAQQLRSARLYLSSAAPLSLEIATKWQEKFGTVISNVYGTTESCVVSFNHSVKYKPGSVGTPVEGVELQVVDAQGQPLPSGERGEIEIRSPGVMSSYWNRPVETTAAFRNGWLRTGDLGRADREGYFYLEGCLKDMVNVGGEKVFPAEVERVLNAHAAILESAVYAVPDPVMGEQVRASVVLKSGVQRTADEITAFCRERLADFKVPKEIDILVSIPKDATGKVDKQKLRQSEQKENDLLPRQRLFAASPDERRRLLKAHIRAEVNKIVGVTPADDQALTDVGMTSLMAIQLANRLVTCFGVSLPATLALEYPTTAAIVDYVAGRISGEEANANQGISQLAPAVDLVPIPRDREIPLSLSQQHRWLQGRSRPGAAIRNLSLYFRLNGKLDAPALRKALDEILRRHEMLRTTFLGANGSAVQVISPTTTADLRLNDLTTLPEHEQSLQLKKLIEEDVQHPFDLACGPLLRVSVMHLGEESFVLGLCLNHLLMDAASVEIFMKELCTLYGAFLAGQPSPLPALPVQYADYAYWQRRSFTPEVLESRRDYWKQWLAIEPPPLRLDIDRAHSEVRTLDVGSQDYTFSPDLTRALGTLSRQSGTTLFVTLLASFATLLSRYGGGEQIVVGVPFAGRNHHLLESLIGLFTVGTIPLRMDFSGNPSFQQVLERTRRAHLSALANGDVPVEPIVQDLQPGRRVHQNPLCRVMLNMVSSKPGETLALAGLAVTPLEAEDRIGRDLILNIWEEQNSHGTRLLGQWRHLTSLYEPEAVATMADDFRAVLESVVTKPEQSVGALPLFPITTVSSKRNWGSK